MAVLMNPHLQLPGFVVHDKKVYSALATNDNVELKLVADLNGARYTEREVFPVLVNHWKEALNSIGRSTKIWDLPLVVMEGPQWTKIRYILPANGLLVGVTPHFIIQTTSHTKEWQLMMIGNGDAANPKYSVIQTPEQGMSVIAKVSSDGIITRLKLNPRVLINEVPGWERNEIMKYEALANSNISFSVYFVAGESGIYLDWAGVIYRFQPKIERHGCFMRVDGTPAGPRFRLIRNQLVPA